MLNSKGENRETKQSRPLFALTK